MKSNGSRWLFSFLAVAFFVCCGGKDRSPLAPSSTLSSYTQTDSSGVTAAEKPALAKNRRKVTASVLKNGQPLAGVDLEFSETGSTADYQWRGRTDANGRVDLEIITATYQFNYFMAQAVDPASGAVVDQWPSLPINGGRKTILKLEVGRQGEVVGVETQSGDAVPTLFVNLDDETPSSASIAKDASSIYSGAQALAPFVRIALTAGVRDVHIPSITFTQRGISSNRTMSALYLYQGDQVTAGLIATATVWDGRRVTFSQPGGFVAVVPRGQTIYLLLRGDLSNYAASGNTIAFEISSLGDITADAEIVGSFPVTGETMSVVAISDLGYVTLANVTPVGMAHVEPGLTAYSAWTVSLAASDQDMDIHRLIITQTGTAGPRDLSNFTLEGNAGQLIAGRVEMTEDKKIIFNLNPAYRTPRNSTVNFRVLCDVAATATGTIHFQVQEMSDLIVSDASYGVFTKPNQADQWVVIESNSSTTYTVIGGGSNLPTSGVLRVSLVSDSPAGIIASGASGELIATFFYEASGEPIRVNSLPVGIAAEFGMPGLNNVKAYLDGVQIGSTNDVSQDQPTLFPFGTSFVVQDGQKRTLQFRADIKTPNGVNLSSGTRFALRLEAGTANARGLRSNLPISTSPITAGTLLVATGTLTLSKNTVFSDASVVNLSGVAGGKQIFLGSFIITTGASEGSTTRRITIADDVRSPGSLGQAFQNLRLVSGGPVDINGHYPDSTQIGQTIGTLSLFNGTTYDFVLSPALVLGPSRQFAVKVYADARTDGNFDGINGDNNGVVYPATVWSVGNLTESNTNGSMSSGLQRVYILPHGTLEVKPKSLPSYSLAAGATSQKVISSFSATAHGEDMSRLGFSWHVPSGGSFLQGNFKLYRNGSLLSPREYSINFDAAGSTGVVGIVFNQNEIFPKEVEVSFEARDDTNVTPDALAKNGGKWELTTVLLPGAAWGVVSGQSTVTPRLDPQTIGR